MKKFLSVILAMLMLFSSATVSFAATSYDFPEAGTCYVEVESGIGSVAGGPCGARAATNEQIEAAERQGKVYTEEQLQRLNAVSSSSPTRSSWIWLSGYIVYSQSSDANCGPACIQSALKYITGSAPSQSAVANACNTIQSGENMGTAVSEMVEYINAQQSHNNYCQLGDMNSSSSLAYYLHRGVTACDAPPIVGLMFSQQQGWAYSANAHFMSVYGAMDDKSAFALADPWIGYAGITDVGWSYAKSIDVIYDAYNYVVGMMY